MKKIIIYTTSSCHWCQQTKGFLKNLGYDYEERSVETNYQYAEEMVQKSGQYGVPVIDIDGKIIIGFSPEEIQEALKQ